MIPTRVPQKHRVKISICIALVCSLVLFSAQAFGQRGSDKVPSQVYDLIASGQPQDLIVLFDDSDIQDEAALMRTKSGARYDTDDILAIKKSRYTRLKQDILDILPHGEFETLQNYSHLPMMFLRVKSLNSLIPLLEHPQAVRLYTNDVYKHFLAQSLPLINQPAVAGMGGAGTTVAVLDTGLIYTRSAFGSCTGANIPGYCCSGETLLGECVDPSTIPPAPPPGCRVACVQDFTLGSYNPVLDDYPLEDDGSMDDSSEGYHGTNVSGIVVGVAPDTHVAGLDVFRGGGAYVSDITAAINWCIAKRTAYNIVAINMSLGGSTSLSPCSGDVLAAPVASARSAGILSAIASGNNAQSNRISTPGCVPAAVSVGAVYDSDVGYRGWSSCIDSTTYADLVTCFSNSAYFLTMLAPGSIINAAGITMSGTSQATPHVAGAIAVLKGDNAFPSETPDQTLARMTSTGVPVTDDRNGITKPRLDLEAAAGGGVPTYTLSGTVTAGGSPLAGVTMTLSGAASRTTTTDGSGDYSFTGLADGAYTVTPNMSGYTFSPTSRTATVSGADVTGQDFTGTAVPTYSLSGNVQASGGGPLAGVTMTLSGASGGTTTTDGSGDYSFTGLADGTYTVTPAMGSYTFAPTSRSVTVSSADVTGQDFTGTAPAVTYSISGKTQVYYSRLRRWVPLSGVTMNLSGASGGTTTTDAGGNYTFDVTDGTYTVTPWRNGYSFTPTNRTVTVNGSNITGQNFTGVYTGITTTYSISGNVTNGGGPLAGATMTLSGASGGTTTTDGSGDYSFTGLSNGSYTVTPSMAGYTFAPPNRSVTVSSANVTGQDFTGTLIPTYSLSGNVQASGGGPLAGATMTLSGTSGGTTTTDGSGDYSFTGLSNGSYTVTPGMAGYTFTPTSRNVTVSSANVTGQDFTGTLIPTYSISGNVQASGGGPLAGATMTLSGTSGGTTTTDGSGDYSFTGLSNGSYTVTPGMAGYTFTPTSRNVTVSSANVTGQDFTGTLIPTYSLSGNVQASGGGPLAGATMTLSGTSGGTTTTDGSGDYSFTGLSNGSYTVTPGMAGYTFTPTSRNVTVSSANVTGQDFTGTPISGSYSISGKTQYYNSRLRRWMPLSGVTVTLNGASGGTTTTDRSGNYSFEGLANGVYTITPSRTGYSFTPTSRNVTISSANVTSINFTGQ